jgi:hypothetical protein
LNYASPTSEKKVGWWVWLLVTLGIIIVVGGIVGFIYKKKSEGSDVAPLIVNN